MARLLSYACSPIGTRQRSVHGCSPSISKPAPQKSVPICNDGSSSALSAEVVCRRSASHERKRSRYRSGREGAGTAQRQGACPNGEPNQAGPYAATTGQERRRASALEGEERILGLRRLEL